MASAAHCAQLSKPHRTGLSIGGVSVWLVDNRDGPKIPEPIQAFRSAVDECDVEIGINWVADDLLVTGRSLFDSGTTWSLHEDPDGYRFDFWHPHDRAEPFKRLFVDARFQNATLLMRQKFFLRFDYPAYPLAYPLDELLIMHRLTQERAIELHGVGIVGPNGATNLFVGHSGAGKSTTARLWTSLHKVEILSDDRIIVRERPARELQPGDDPRQIFMYGTPWHGEGCFALPQRAPLQRIFVLEHGHGNVLTRLTRSQMVGELFARAFVPFHRHEYIDNALSFLERVADSVPCYRYSFEPDERAVQKVLQFND
jgi:energy-coupling factor transporter ATP-binding protein EcfA2